MNDTMNGMVVADPPPEVVDVIASEVQTGLARFYEQRHENAVLAKQLDAATLEVERLKVALAGAADNERNHVQMVIDEAKIAQHKAEVEVCMLQDEIAALRRDLTVAHRVAQDARVEAARLTAALAMVGSNVLEILNQRPAQVGQEVTHGG